MKKRWVIITTLDGVDLPPQEHDFFVTRRGAAKVYQVDQDEIDADGVSPDHLHYRVERV
jgi:hypothetical protein